MTNPAGPGFWQRLLAPPLRPALGLAALVIVAGAAFVATRGRTPGPDSQLRGSAPAPSPGVVIERAERSERALGVAWRAVPGAESYELHFYSPDLAPIGQAGPYAGLAASLPLDSLSFRPGRTLLVRVVALASGDVLASSSVRAFPPR